MECLFIEYPKCSTCKKAKKFLDSNNVIYDDRNIVVDNPKKEELRKWVKISGYPIKKFFNTSGLLYKEFKLKEKIPTLSEEELLDLLETNGMLVKRPILVKGDKVLVGFKEEEWENI